MTEKEYERKLLIGEGEYTALLRDFNENFVREDIFQINYYYDTHDFKLYHAGETLRVRQIGGVLKLQYKHNKIYTGGLRVSDEYSETICDFPKAIAANGIEAYNIGFMATERSNFKLADYVISLDKNYYLGTLDYEIEAESAYESELPKLLQKLNFEIAGKGKYSRYVDRLSQQRGIINLLTNEPLTTE